jgi:hypothetical protein
LDQNRYQIELRAKFYCPFRQPLIGKPFSPGVWQARELQKLTCQRILWPLDVLCTQDGPTHDRDQRRINQMMCGEFSPFTISDYDSRSVQ